MSALSDYKYKAELYELFGYDSDTQALPQENDQVCLLCYRTFADKGCRVRHERRVHGKPEKRLACGVCNKGFYNASSLRVHMRRHTDERPYDCSHCGKAFKQQIDRDRHVRAVEEGRKDYACIECGKRFGYGAGLRHHTMQYH